jgi:hypothetical protein
MLNIITPCSKPQNLDLVYESIRENTDTLWHICFDLNHGIPIEVIRRWHNVPNTKVYVSSSPSAMGNPERNLVLFGGQIPDEDWVYFLDDDNLLVPRFAETMRNLESQFVDKEGFIFEQFCQFGIRVVDVRVGCIDQAQYILKRKFIGENRFEMKYEADGLMITKLYGEHPEKFEIINQPLCHYNRLKW